MAQEYKLELDKRTDTGRKAAKNYRSSGSIPGIFIPRIMRRSPSSLIEDICTTPCSLIRMFTLSV